MLSCAPVTAAHSSTGPRAKIVFIVPSFALSAPKIHSPADRVLVSSTFGDLKGERDALQHEVFPKLRRLCE
jgi:hypothetical protein